MKDFIKKLGQKIIKTFGVTLAFAGTVVANSLPPTPEKEGVQEKAELVCHAKQETQIISKEVIRANNSLPPTPEKGAVLTARNACSQIISKEIIRANNSLPPTPECIAKNRINASRITANRQHIYC